MQTAKSSNEATLFMLKKEKEIKLNYSKMGRESGDISHTQIKRYINGETSCVPDKPLRVLVNTFGDSPSRKNWLRMKLRERCKQSNKISKKNAERRKALTGISDSYYALVAYLPLFSDTLKRYSKPHVLILVEIIEKANNVPVVKIQFEIDQKGKHTKKIIVNKLLLKDQPIKKKTASQIDEIQYYNQYCTENCIHRYSLLQLAQEAVMDEPRLQPISYKDKSLPFDTEDSDSGSYMVEVREFNNWRKFLEEIQGIRKDNTNVLKSEQKINLILGGMDAIEHSADQAVKNRDCLFQYIEELISKLS